MSPCFKASWERSIVGLSSIVICTGWSVPSTWSITGSLCVARFPSFQSTEKTKHANNFPFPVSSRSQQSFVEDSLVLSWILFWCLDLLCHSKEIGTRNREPVSNVNINCTIQRSVKHATYPALFFFVLLQDNYSWQWLLVCQEASDLSYGWQGTPNWS